MDRCLSWATNHPTGSDTPTPTSFCPILQLLCWPWPVWKRFVSVMLSVFLLKEKWKDDRNIDTHTQHFPILFRSIFVCVCKLPPPETLQSSYMWSKLPVSPRHFVPILEEMFCNVYKSVYSMSQCSCVCGMFNCFHVRNQEKCLCPKNLFVSTAWVKGKLCVTCGFQMYGKSLFTEHQDSRSAKGEKNKKHLHWYGLQIYPVRKGVSFRQIS